MRSAVHPLRVARRAGARRRSCRPTPPCNVVGQLAAAGAREVVLIGGEAYLHPGFLDVVAGARAGRHPPDADHGRARRHARAGRAHEGGRPARRVRQRRRARADARSDARLSRQLRVGDRGADPSARGRHTDGRQHEPEPAQRARPRRGLRAPRPARDLVVAGPAHRAAWSRRRPARPHLAAVGPARPRAAGDCAQGQGTRGRRPADAREQPRLLRPGRGHPSLGDRRRAGPLARVPGRSLRSGDRVRRSRQGLSVAADRALRRRQPARDEAWRRSGIRRPSSRSRATGPSPTCGAFAGPAPSLRRAWAAARSPPIRYSGVPATTPTATTARARWPAPAGASAWSRKRARRACRSTTGPSTSSKSRSTRPIRRRRRRRCW